ncbi:hypothetical protein [Emticicia agri]|uniref:GNAT family N-acetyltransferase n=1 Tax=Emticicia agri TaxID=2492393 RepID=A0A4V1ZCU6_9BACT|nr:hypothetical protein [Emticicia agri]RYU93890.1 hypothetical protein EWM59_19820 [Emticicia agri]
MYLILRATQERIEARIDLLDTNDLLKLKKGWLFDWRKEYEADGNYVYKVITPNNDVIHGLLSVKRKNDHLYVNLLEKSNLNKGKEKAYDNVAGILLAFSCRLAFAYDYDGFVVFDSKTILINHYSKFYGARVLSGQRMYFDTVSAKLLIEKFLL